MLRVLTQEGFDFSEVPFYHMVVEEWSQQRRSSTGFSGASLAGDSLLVENNFYNLAASKNGCGKVSELSPTFVVIKRTFMHYHCVWTTLCEITVFIPNRKTIQINQYTHTYIQYNKETCLDVLLPCKSLFPITHTSFLFVLRQRFRVVVFSPRGGFSKGYQTM